MSSKFEDLMKPGFSRSCVSPVESPPDSVRWVNLLTALCVTSLLIALCRPESVADGVFCALFYGMIIGPVVFMMGHGFCTMCGGKQAWWVGVGFFVFTFFLGLFILYQSFGIGWLL